MALRLAVMGSDTKLHHKGSNFFLQTRNKPTEPLLSIIATSYAVGQFKLLQNYDRRSK